MKTCKTHLEKKSDEASNNLSDKELFSKKRFKQNIQNQTSFQLLQSLKAELGKNRLCLKSKKKLLCLILFLRKGFSFFSHRYLMMKGNFRPIIFPHFSSLTLLRKLRMFCNLNNISRLFFVLHFLTWQQQQKPKEKRYLMNKPLSCRNRKHRWTMKDKEKLRQRQTGQMQWVETPNKKEKGKGRSSECHKIQTDECRRVRMVVWGGVTLACGCPWRCRLVTRSTKQTFENNFPLKIICCDSNLTFSQITLVSLFVSIVKLFELLPLSAKRMSLV